MSSPIRIGRFLGALALLASACGDLNESSACDGVNCGEHGDCVDVAGVPTCDCADGAADEPPRMAIAARSVYVLSVVVVPPPSDRIEEGPNMEPDCEDPPADVPVPSGNRPIRPDICVVSVPICIRQVRDNAGGCSAAPQ